MGAKRKKFRIGLRTLKTAAAATVAMVIVNSFGTSASKLIFAMFGAMTAMEPTFRDSLKSSLTQIVGLLYGGLVGVLLLMLPISPLVVAVMGMIVVIISYNLLNIRFSPSLPCLIVVIVCTTPNIDPLGYAIERCWDTTIGLLVGIVINILVFPYDNSCQIRDTARGLDRELLLFLEDMFDKDKLLPDTEKMVSKIDDMAKQLKIFSNQWFLLRRRKHRREFKSLKICEGKARQLVAQMEVLCRMEIPGRLNDENRRRLVECGANIHDQRFLEEAKDMDIVTNYHVSRILDLRKELLEELEVKQDRQG